MCTARRQATELRNRIFLVLFLLLLIYVDWGGSRGADRKIMYVVWMGVFGYMYTYRYNRYINVCDVYVDIYIYIYVYIYISDVP